MENNMANNAVNETANNMVNETANNVANRATREIDTTLNLVVLKKQLLTFYPQLIFMCTLLLSCAAFLQWANLRVGMQLNDPVLNLFPAIKIDGVIFILVYSTIFLALYENITSPNLGILFESYAWVVLLRMISIYLVPLEPPAGMIELRDPFVELFGKGNVVNRDLFFSGHTATCLIMYLNSRNAKIKKTIGILGILVAIGVVLQKVHYTIDVVGAVFFAFCAYKFTLWRVRKNKT